MASRFDPLLIFLTVFPKLLSLPMLTGFRAVSLHEGGSPPFIIATWRAPQRASGKVGNIEGRPVHGVSEKGGA